MCVSVQSEGPLAKEQQVRAITPAPNIDRSMLSSRVQDTWIARVLTIFEHRHDRYMYLHTTSCIYHVDMNRWECPSSIPRPVQLSYLKLRNLRNSEWQQSCSWHIPRMGSKSELGEKGLQGCWEMWICGAEEIQALPAYIISEWKRSNRGSMVRGVTQHESIFWKYVKQLWRGLRSDNVHRQTEVIAHEADYTNMPHVHTSMLE